MSSKWQIQAEFRKSMEHEVYIAFITSMDKLEMFWNEFGFTEEKCMELSNKVLDQIKTLLAKVVKEEDKNYLNKKNCIKKYKVDLTQLCSELEEQADEPEETLSLLQKEQILRARLQNLMQKKQARIEKYKHMQKLEKRLYGILGMPEKSHVCSTVPKEKELCELEQQIHVLSDEKERRYHKYWAAKKKLSTILEETDFVAETSFDRKVIYYDEGEDHVLSQEKIDQLQVVLGKVEQFQQKMIKDIEELSGKLDKLWDQLNISKKTRENFKEKHAAFRRSTLVALKREIEHCKELKVKKIKKDVFKLREELMDLWQKCFISTNEKCQFEPFYSEKYTDNLLRLHAAEVDRLKQYVIETKGIIEKINKRQELWDTMLAFERKVCDPNRFNNRGGSLLQEERERNKLLKDLPALEEEILQDIREYEEKKDTLFLVNGINFSEFIKIKWDEHQKKKENRRMERQRRRSMLVQQTPSKNPVFCPPASAPEKLVNRNTNLPLSIKQRLVAKKLPIQSCEKHVEKLKNPSLTTPRSTKQRTPTEKSNVNIKPTLTTSNNTTSYDDFARELNKEHRMHYRSTLATKRKVLGSKINHNGSFKKSRISSNNSPRSSQSSSKTAPSECKTKSRTPTSTTPIRGKLGLPFLL